MSSHIAIVDALRSAAAGNESIVLATVVRVIGSSYGGIGARMIVRVDGSTVGLVSGGCLESDLCAHAIEVHATGQARVVTYDTRADDDAVWGLGLGCNGLIDVLLLSLSPEQASLNAEMLGAALSDNVPSVIATVVRTESRDGAPGVGAQARFTHSGTTSIGDWGDGSSLSVARARLDDALAAGRRGFACEVSGGEIAFEVVAPAVQLVICGAGPDAVPVNRLARGLGWDVTLIDHRPITDAHVERFPGARAIECATPGRLAESMTLTARTAAVVMSHHFARDADYLQSLLQAGVAYIGVLGPRARMERMLAELATRGAAIPARTDDLFGPVGLDLGGDGLEAIALAIIAEVSAVMNDREAGHLRDRRAALHEAMPTSSTHAGAARDVTAAGRFAGCLRALHL